MSKPDLRVIPIDWKRSDTGDLAPKHPDFYARVMQYCEENLAEVPDLRDYRKAYAVVEFGENGELIDIHGVTAERGVPDIAIFRTTGEYARRATKMLHDRWQSFFADNGLLGQDVLIWIDGEENPEQQCPNRDCSIQEFNLRPAKRMLVRVR